MTPDEKRRLKDAVKVARIAGGCRGIAEGITWEDFNKQGAIDGLNKLADMADELLKEMQDDR